MKVANSGPLQEIRGEKMQNVETEAYNREPVMGVRRAAAKIVAKRTQGIMGAGFEEDKDRNGIAVARRAVFMLKTNSNFVRRLDER